MISKDEIRDSARTLGVGSISVQRDYVFGWLLWAIYTTTDLRTVLILKGGNCLRKAYFEHTRYSNDLDFATQVPVDADFLRREMNKACLAVQAATSVRFEPDNTRVDESLSADRDQHIYKVKLYFHDFFGKREEATISVRLDIAELDKIHLPLNSRNLIHAYSDRPDCRATLTCLSLEETLAAKLKCLMQRRHISDLYDFGFAVFFDKTIEVDRSLVARTFLQKTIFGGNPRAGARILAGVPLEGLSEAWSRFIVCPRQSILSFADVLTSFRQLLQSLFEAFPASLSELAYFPPELRNPIMEAGANLTVLRVVYDGIPRVVEPYSLVFKKRKDGVAREYLYVRDRTGGRSGTTGIKSFIPSGFTAIETTDEKFEPVEEVTICKAGEFGDQLYFGSQTPFYKRPARRSRPRRWPSVPRRVYTVQCLVCGRQFTRFSRSLTMRSHKDSFGNDCLGRRGFVVSQSIQ